MTEKKDNEGKATFSEPISPAERFAEDGRTGGTPSNLKYNGEVASGKWQVEKDRPSEVEKQVRLLLEFK